ncbi:MAG: hypothetical protein F4X56_01070 [Gammaproteobacteria bacterium]|nr:hypothetical protein [Gammaproteobacteria bacterium]MYC24492.1 hypothetical protein [Gammaproteobacteria bacterium]
MVTPTNSRVKPETSSIVRLCVNGRLHRRDTPDDNISAARTLIERALHKDWPKGVQRVDFTVLPGGFIFDRFPNGLDGVDTGWISDNSNFEVLKGYGEKCIRRVLSEEAIRVLAKRTKYLTVGIDLKHISDDKIGKKAIKRPHIELVAVLKLTGRRASIVAWTGKSYPTDEQQYSLVHVVDLSTHCVTVDGLRILVLGCHDLNVFNPRIPENKRLGINRRIRIKNMRREAARFDPSIVIQHPHQTDSPKIWLSGWSGIKKILPSVEQGLSGIAYFPHPLHRAARQKLSKVLEGTKFGSNIEDVVIEGFKETRTKN